MRWIQLLFSVRLLRVTGYIRKAGSVFNNLSTCINLRQSALIRVNLRFSREIFRTASHKSERYY